MSAQMVIFRGERMHIEDARMQVPLEQFCEIEVELENGETVRPYRFDDPCPVVGRDAHGILSIG